MVRLPCRADGRARTGSEHCVTIEGSSVDTIRYPVLVGVPAHEHAIECSEGRASILRFPSNVMGHQDPRIRYSEKGRQGSVDNDKRCLGRARDSNARRDRKCCNVGARPAIGF